MKGASLNAKGESSHKRSTAYGYIRIRRNMAKYLCWCATTFENWVTVLKLLSQNAQQSILINHTQLDPAVWNHLTYQTKWYHRIMQLSSCVCCVCFLSIIGQCGCKKFLHTPPYPLLCMLHQPQPNLKSCTPSADALQLCLCQEVIFHAWNKTSCFSSFADFQSAVTGEGESVTEKVW